MNDNERYIFGLMHIAIKYIDAPIYVQERDGHVHPSYTIEKLESAKRCIEYALHHLLEEVGEQDEH